jgi:deoxyribose-phosphate aldolase
VRLAVDLLSGSGVPVCTVVGFPLGAATSSSKAFETSDAIALGADEIDMVVNIGDIKSNDYSDAAKDIARVRKAVPAGKILKVIIEAAALTDTEIASISKICVEEGADFVKTSTGMHPSGGARLEHVKLIRRTIGERVGIKAAGGIKTCSDLLKFVESGATRIGCSASVQIMQDPECQKLVK